MAKWVSTSILLVIICVLYLYLPEGTQIDRFIKRILIIFAGLGVILSYLYYSRFEVFRTTNQETAEIDPEESENEIPEQARKESSTDGNGRPASRILTSIKMSSEPVEIPVLWGRYLNSFQGEYPYKPYWQSVLCERVIQKVEDRLGKECYRSDDWEDWHIYTFVERSIENIHFYIPLEIIFLSSERKRHLNINRLGYCTTLSLIYTDKDDLVDRSIIEYGNEENKLPDYGENVVANGKIKHSFENFAEKYVRGDYKICTPTMQLPDTKLWSLIAEEKFSRQNKKSYPRAQEISSWLSQYGPKGIVACDVGLVGRIVNKLETDVYVSLIDYENRVPVGISYPSKDREWGEEYIGWAMSAVLNESDDRIQGSVLETKERFRDLCLEWNPSEDILMPDTKTSIV